MRATEITVIGHVATPPRRSRVPSGVSVTNFRLAATESYFDRERQQYVDRGTFWADVECWDELGGNVAYTLAKGDPVIVVGTVTTREWETETGRGSTAQIRAEAVGPNLSRGSAEFRRTPRAQNVAAEAEAATPAEDEAVEGYRDGSAAEFENLDYEVTSETLEGMNPDTSSAPAFA